MPAPRLAASAILLLATTLAACSSEQGANTSGTGAAGGSSATGGSGGAGITFECEYDNPTDQTLTFGESAVTNEMCILSGRYYPSANGETVECN